MRRHRHKHQRREGFSHVNNIIVLWVLVILVNFGIMWLGQFAITSASGIANIVLAAIIAAILYIDSCLATVDVQKRRLEIKSDFLKPNRKKLNISGLMVLILLAVFRFI